MGRARTSTRRGRRAVEPSRTASVLVVQPAGDVSSPFGLWGSRTRFSPLTCRLGCALVLVDQPSEDRLASDPLLGGVRDGMIGAWREKPKRSMWPPTVVVGAVARE